jgi:hypothetical protein
VKAGTWRERLEPSLVQSGHCQPTGAWIMHSVQIGRLQWAQSTEAGRSGWRPQAGGDVGSGTGPLT